MVASPQLKVAVTTTQLPPVNVSTGGGAGPPSARTPRPGQTPRLALSKAGKQISGTERTKLENQKTMLERTNEAKDVRQKIFKQFDHDGSGKVGINELRAAKKALGKFLSDEQLEQLIESADQDLDGQIDFKEFCTKWQTITGRSLVASANMVIGPLKFEDEPEPGLVVDITLPVAPPDGMRKRVVAAERSFRAPEAAEIRLLRQDCPIKAPGFDGPGDVSADLRNLPALERVSAQPRYGILQIVDLDISRAKKFTKFKGDFFSHVPYLKELRLRFCPQLISLDGLTACSSLEILDVSRCEKLISFGAINSKRSCNRLRFVDLDGCKALSDQESYAMVKDFLEYDPSTPRPNVVSQEVLHSCVPSCKLAVTCPGNHMLSRFNTEKLGLLHCAVCITSIGTWQKIQACRTCGFYVCHDCALKSSQAAVMMTWPSWSRGKSFTRTLAPNTAKALTDTCREGAREKLRSAFAAGRVAIHANAGKLTSTQANWGCARDPRDDRRLQDINDAISLVEEAGLIDLHLLRQNADVLQRFLPEKEIPCYNNCGKKILVQDWPEHSKTCMFECPKCGMFVFGEANFKHHKEVEEELMASLKTWNHKRIKRALTVATTHCMACKLPPLVIGSAEAKLWHLQKKFKTLRDAGLLARGNISVDVDNCRVNMEVELPFANRQQPDTSAEIVAGKEQLADGVIKDLAIVINVFQVTMTIEGHTGASEPRDYWAELALNRAKLISGTMIEKYNVNAILALPRGEPGGGAKVIVRPAELSEIFQSFDLDGTGTIDSSELRQASAALGSFMSPEKVKELIREADGSGDGLIDYQEFCANFAKFL